MSPETKVFPEVEAAAKWWANVMSAPHFQDNGDGLQSGLATLARTLVEKLNADERARFEMALQTTIQEHVIRGDWERAKSEPLWASSVRIIGVDYGPDRVLDKAAEAVAAPDDHKTQARISLLWPIKTMMRIDPGCVAVKCGYGQPEVVIYPASAEGSAE